MEKKKIPVITINREYGAGGRSLAAILSEKLGIPYYDRDFVRKTMEESGYDEEDIEREGEEISRPSQMFEHFLNSTVSFSSSHDAIFRAEKKVILKLAESPCILIGRCADRILAEAGIDNISIYLHAPLEKRHDAVARLYGQDHRYQRPHGEDRRALRSEYHQRAHRL